MSLFTIGVDLGGTNIRVALVDEKGSIVRDIEKPTEAEKGPEFIISRMLEMIKGIGLEHVSGIGIGSPGPLNPYQGIILSPPNLPGWNEIPLADIVHKEISVPVFIDNDANAAALAEAVMGAGAGHRQVVYITISTGIGSGIVIDGKVYQGAKGNAGEIGNMIVDPSSKESWSSLNAGSLEALASGTAIGRRGSERLGMELNAAQVFQMAASGNAIACSIIDEAVGYLAVGIANLSHVLDPDIYILGGGVMKSSEFILEPLKRKVTPLLYQNMQPYLKIEAAKLGTKAGVIGAALLPRMNL